MEIEATVETVSVALPVIPLQAADIVAVPVVAAEAAARPRTTVATFTFDDVQVTKALRSCAAPFWSVAVAVNCAVVPSAIVCAGGVTASVLTGETVSVTDPANDPDDAVMVAVPAITPVTSPLLLTDATEGFELSHATGADRDPLSPSARFPVAANCMVVSGAMLGVPGVTLIATIGDVPGVPELFVPQPCTKSNAINAAETASVAHLCVKLVFIWIVFAENELR